MKALLVYFLGVISGLIIGFDIAVIIIDYYERRRKQ